MSKVLKVDGNVGVGFESAQEFLHVMDFLQEMAVFANEEFGSEDCPVQANTIEEFFGKLCIAQLMESCRRITENPEMLDEIKLSAMMEQRNGSHGAKNCNDSMYG